MNTARNWGVLPAEIIQIIFERLSKKYEERISYIEYQLVNKWCSRASASVVYRNVTVKEKERVVDYNDNDVDDYDNDGDDDSLENINEDTTLEKYESLINLLKNTLHNIGQHVKEIKIETSPSVFILESLIKYCPIVSYLSLSESTEEASNYVKSLQGNGDNEAAIWKNLERADI
jgi:hypothetical protein